MGTSKSFSTPTGGKWRSVKINISRSVGGGACSNPEAIVSGTADAANGFRGGAGGGGGGGIGGGTSAVSKSISGVGTFGGAVLDGGLDFALESFQLEDLRGRPAVEVVERVAEKITAHTDSLLAEQLRKAFRDSIFEAAAIEGDMTYENLDESLQNFIDHEGIDSLVELFLKNFVFNYLWGLIEDHVQKKCEEERDFEATASAVEGVCHSQVRNLIDEMREANRFENIDWFGGEGQRIGQEIAETLEERLRTFSSGEGR